MENCNVWTKGEDFIITKNVALGFKWKTGAS
jgi:hypothetical protein